MGPPGKVCPTPQATSSLGTACSMRASTVCEHQNITKLLHVGKSGVFCHFHGLNRLIVSKSNSKKGIGNEVMGMGQERTGARLSLQAVATHQRLSDLRKGIQTAVTNWKFIIGAVKG